MIALYAPAEWPTSTTWQEVIGASQSGNGANSCCIDSGRFEETLVKTKHDRVVCTCRVSYEHNVAGVAAVSCCILLSPAYRLCTITEKIGELHLRKQAVVR